MTNSRIVPSTPTHYVHTDKDTVEQLRFLLLEPDVDSPQWVLQEVYKLMGLDVPDFVWIDLDP